VYERNRRLFFSTAFNVLHDREESEDCVQDVLARLWERRAKYDFASASIISLAVVSIRNAALDRLRRRNRQPELHRRIGAVTQLTEEIEVRDYIEHDRLAAAIRDLPVEQRRPLLMAYYQHKTYPQIAAELGIPLGTIKSRLSLAMRRLAKSLKKDAPPNA
jgi:RNA polymerase sigma-70 factor (ECF subfamily)